MNAFSPERPVFDRSLLLYGPKRNSVLTLEELWQYGRDSFGDANYVRLYGMSPAEWYARGIRLLGRTAVECTRDALADCIGCDIAAAAGKFRDDVDITVLDPFAGSCNSLYWIVRRVPRSAGIGFELDDQVFALTWKNLSCLEANITLRQGGYRSLLASCDVAAGQLLIVFVAPPWGTALDESAGLDLTRTSPPVRQIFAEICGRYSGHPILFATQVFEKVTPGSLAELESMLDWSDVRMYNLNMTGCNHGVLLGTLGWKP